MIRLHKILVRMFVILSEVTPALDACAVRISPIGDRDATHRATPQSLRSA
jgi:hypothetical protein